MNSLLRVFVAFFFALFILSGCGKEDEVTPDTTLEITLNNNLGNSVSGANVKLYASQTDMQRNLNKIGETQISDANGKVTFKGLKAIQYYWLAEKDCNNNMNGSVTTTAPITAETANTVTSVLTSTGTIVYVNNSSNPYKIYVNGTLIATAQGNMSYESTYVPTGSYTIRVVQESGYAISPTDQTYTGTLVCGGTLTTTFPN